MLAQARSALRQLPLCDRAVVSFMLTRTLSTSTLLRSNTGPDPTRWKTLGRVFNFPHDPQVQALRNTGPKTGLCGHPELTHPNGLHSVCRRTLREAERLNEQIKSAKPSLQLLDDIDYMSDVLCGVVDMTEFLRNTHPDPDYVHACEETCKAVHAQFEKLNTDVELYSALERVIDLPEFQTVDRETDMTARLFKYEFDQSCVKGPEAERVYFQELTQAQIYLGFEFMNGAHAATNGYVEVPAAALEELPESVRAQLRYDPIRQKPGMVILETDTVVCDLILKWVRDGSVRRAVYIATYRCDPKREEVLHRLLQVRHRLAQVTKYPTYAHRTLQETMAGSPETVQKFLYGVAERLRPTSEKETAMLKALKARLEQTDEGIMAWDRSYYTGIAKNNSLPRAEVAVHHYFSLGGVMEGLDTIFQSLFGVSLVPVPTAPGELWAPDVIKLAVQHEKEGPLGYIYADLYARENKSGQASQYTIRSGRQLKDGTYQQPVVGLMCSFRPPTETEPTLLSHYEVETLFHEMGHAMHSILGRTKYHHVQGTRCKVDFVEIPSILMEFFVWDYRVLSKFARHYATGEVLPESALERLCQSRHMFAANEALMQVFMALMDQAYYGPHPLPASPTELLGRVQDDVTTIPHVPGTAWQLSFSHLYGYGASYYTYMWSKALANLIWQTCFAKDPLNREAGERYCREMLAHGGGEDPWVMITRMLGFTPTIENLTDSIVRSYTSTSTPVL
eukprot:comp23415_c0_seq1/m.38924 comp23415_c0_seq1/g.38924  ORF comp23415_c0_seq1/g.38924 comp23415_c0_seq1/m.38924 type:complete len:735 (-) comp23415_c0_seq1:23-2227(-)